MPVMGYEGQIYISGDTGESPVAFADTWTLNAAIGQAEITGYGNSAKVFSPTLRDWSVAMTATLDRTDTDQAALLDQWEDGTLSSLNVVLITVANSSLGGTTEFWSGKANAQTHSVNSSVGDKVSVTFNMIGSSALSYTVLA